MAQSHLPRALFLNGVFDAVFKEIAKAQNTLRSGISYLQPHKGSVIKSLRETPPAPENPVRLYASTSDLRSKISYTAEIIGWEDKRELSTSRRRQVREHLLKFQRGEVALFDGEEAVGDKPVNLLTIRNLEYLKALPRTGLLIKVSDDTPLSEIRSQSGGWSPVYDNPDIVPAPRQTREQYEADLKRQVDASRSLSRHQRAALLAAAPTKPQRVQIISVGFRRNPHVIATVLDRAGRFCEQCHSEAPFNRRLSGSPYLEVHHRIPLSQEGDDTVENAMALCPNCHRKAHHG